MLTTKEEQKIISSLDAPGAGIPFIERIMMRYCIGPFIAGRSDWNDNRKKFVGTGRAIISTAEKFKPEELSTRKLVPRATGLEDSSRYWSIAMTLNHVVIVGQGIRDIIIRLSQGQVPPGRVDTARVKPLPGADPAQALQTFRQYLDTVQGQIADALVDIDSPAVYPHPWFGDFTLRQWHWLLAAHQEIHLRQVREIAQRLEQALPFNPKTPLY